jgi:tRNA threonylcarbamoyladenosine biosynthesis protein TsaB
MKMNPILCIETGTSTCSVAIGYNDTIIDIEETHNDSNNHAANLTMFIQKILQRQGLSVSNLAAVAISKGPGSYTGLRIGVSAAKGICYGANLPLIGVGSLESMVYGAMQMQEATGFEKPDLFCPMIDARRMEVYTQLFDMNRETISDIEAKILDSSSYADLLNSKKILFFGNGSLKVNGVINHPNALFLDNFLPSARFMITIASRLYNQNRFEDVAYFEPLYLKDFVATIAKNKVLGSS